MFCDTDANPVPGNYSWYRYNDKKQVDSKIWSSASNTLPFKEIQRADEACYSCTATNAISTGKKSESLCIVVHCKYFGKFGNIFHYMFNSCMSGKVKKNHKLFNLEQLLRSLNAYLISQWHYCDSKYQDLICWGSTQAWEEWRICDLNHFKHVCWCHMG